MTLDKIGFYTLSDVRATNVATNHKIMPLPYSRCEIIITNKCNFKCPYCRGIDCNEMDIEEIKNIINTLGAIRNIRFSGGEPTLNPSLEEAVSFAKNHGIERIAISTNGSMPFEKYQRLIDLGVNDFSISLDACCASMGDMMAGNKSGAWNKVIENIKRISSITYVTVGIVITEENIAEVKNIIEFADSLNVSDIRVIPSAQYNQFLDVLVSLNPRLYQKRPILKYRITEASNGHHVRGLTSTDTTKCPLVIDDIAIKGDCHYPCIIYMREHGMPIGRISDGKDKIHKDRIAWFESHNTHEDPICKKNCLDVCIEYNNRCMEEMKRV